MTESFLPTLNGVTTSVCRVVDCLLDTGHTVQIIAPAPAPAHYRTASVQTVRGVTVRQFRVGLPTPDVQRILANFAPDVVHVASPFGLGARGISAARDLGIPCVAVYQTDMPGYLRQHGGPIGSGVQRAAWRWLRHFHSAADLTLAPSTAALADLAAHGVPRARLWQRGVDLEAFRPQLRAQDDAAALRAVLAPAGEVVIGYVGRLAPEKECHRLATIADLPGTSLMVVGDGPARREVEQQLPRASFLGYRSGAELAAAYAACDIFVHTGTRETFGQTLQEAMATGLPVVAPARGGPLDIVRPGVTGLLFDPDRPQALREAVGSLVADPRARARMGAAGRRVVSERTWPAMTEQLVAHYREVRLPRRRRIA